MRLKRLELFGFKSFADRTVFDFRDNSLTGVVGPNGCGKSNVVDSVRWVLGEQRPTSMRGAEMTDVIFKGSASRPGLSVAEATLTIDNSKGELEGRGPEVQITRRVFKSGEGEYLLDGDKVRLKDVREMLFDTGLGSRGYSVLEQGKIDAVLSANPLERRRIFEEAAGISRYRQRKIETELRLKRVAEDMARVDDVLGELGSRVRSLKIQAGKAERWVAARGEWTSEKTRLFKHRLFGTRLVLERLRARAAELDTRVDTLRLSRTNAEADADVRERERGTLADHIDRLAAELASVAGDGRMVDERRAQLSSRVASWRESAREERSRADHLAALLDERERELGLLGTDLAELEERVLSCERVAGERSSALRALERDLREAREGVERQNRATLELFSTRNQAENRIHALEASRAPAREREERLAERLGSTRDQVAALNAEEATLVLRAADAHKGFGDFEQHRRELAQRMALLAQDSAQAEAEKKNVELERARVQSRIDVLLARARDFEELSAGAKRVLEGVETRGEPCGQDELSGLVADLLRTDTSHARALDAVLGARANALVAGGVGTLQSVLGWLKKREGGQVGLVLRAGLAAVPVRSAVPAEARIHGRLLDRVRAPLGAEPLADLLCGDVLIASDLDAALELVRVYPVWRFVTLDGQFVDAAGVHGGHRSLSQGSIGRRSSADELAGTVTTLSARVEELEARRAQISQERAALQKEWERSSQELEVRRGARVQAEMALQTARARLQDQVAGLRSLEQESGVAGLEIGRIEQELAAAKERRDKAQESLDAERARLAALEEQRASLERAREELGRSESEAQLEAARARTELSGQARRLADLARMRDENRAEHERAARIAEEHGKCAGEGALDGERLALQSQELLTERGRLELALVELRGALDSGRGFIDAARSRVDEVTRSLETSNFELGELRLEEQRHVLAREDVLRRAAEDLELDEERLLAGFEPEAALAAEDALEALDSAVRELKLRLDKVGPVNMEAMAELAESGARLEFLTSQRDDLARARSALEATIQTIDGESKKLFLETFEAVRTNFQRVFRQLFGGGKADVVLEENVDPLESGVDIVARPPGRELLSIGLLSGGQRTLTALALLFAVFEARPSPFCILDEVDAALDDANIERFLAMVNGYRQNTQFIVVTHNKGTMSACESLYGVTMEVKGVSRQVSVELGEVDSWTGRAAPGAARMRTAAVAGVSLERGESAAEPARRAIDRDTALPIVELVPAASSEAVSATNLA